MRKRVIPAFMAALMLTACTSKTDELPEQTPTEPMITEELTGQTEPPFRELTPEDFTHISVNVEKHPGEPPVDADNFELSGLHFPKKVSPCYDEEYIDRMTAQGDPDILAALDGADYREPWEGVYSCEYFDSEKVYYSVWYDRFRLHEVKDYQSHCWSIYEYDRKTAEIREIYAYSDPVETLSFDDCVKLNGCLWFTTSKHRTAEDGSIEVTYYINCLDLDTLKVTTCREIPYFITFIPDDDRLLFKYTEDLGTTDNYKGNTNVICEYHPETETIEELFHSDKVSDSVMTEKGLVSCVKNDDYTRTILSDRFRLDTGMKHDMRGAGEHNVTVAKIESSSKPKVSTYNFDKMECYDLDFMPFEGFVTDVIGCGDDLLIDTGNGTYFFYLMPEYGVCNQLFSCYTSAYITDGTDTMRLYSSRGVENGKEERFCLIRKRKGE